MRVRSAYTDERDTLAQHRSETDTYETRGQCNEIHTHTERERWFEQKKNASKSAQSPGAQPQILLARMIYDVIVRNLGTYLHMLCACWGVHPECAAQMMYTQRTHNIGPRYSIGAVYIS